MKSAELVHPATWALDARRPPQAGPDDGMVTAELAACLPALMLVVAMAVWVIAACSAQARAGDAARELARAAARGDLATGRSLAAAQAPGAVLSVHLGDARADAVARLQIRPLGGLFPALHVVGRAVAGLEPDVSDGSGASAAQDASGSHTPP